jgi:hypothetical protein
MFSSGVSRGRNGAVDGSPKAKLASAQGDRMRKVSEYRAHAEECRKMAAKMKNSEHRKQLEDMAEAWNMLARERQKQIEKHSELQSAVEATGNSRSP